MDGVYLVLSLGLEFEGFHFKLVATVVFPNNLDVFEKPQTPIAYNQSYMERQKLLHTNAYAKWTPEDDSELLKLSGKGLSIKELTKIFERNEGAIRSRIKKLTMEPQDNEKDFDSDEEALVHLIELKDDIERQIEALREKINMKQSIQ